MSEIPPKFNEYKINCRTMSLEDMVQWLMEEEEEHRVLLGQFMEHVSRPYEKGRVYYTFEWKKAVEANEDSYACLFMKNKLQELDQVRAREIEEKLKFELTQQKTLIKKIVDWFFSA